MSSSSSPSPSRAPSRLEAYGAPSLRVTAAVASLGFARAASGPLAIASMIVGGVTAVIAVGASIAVARGGGTPPVAEATSVAASALAWGAGVMLAFAASARELRKDREEGVLALAVARGSGVMEYVAGRTLGLAALLALVVGGGTLAAGLGGIFAAPASAAPAAAQGLFASMVYALAFAAVLAPVAMAAVGARSRSGGYLSLVAVLVLPELGASLSTHTLSPEVREVISLPGALAAVRGGLMLASFDLARAARGAFVLALVVVVAVALVRAEVRRGEVETPA